MELTQVLLIVGAIAIVVFAVIAIRGSFRGDDAFYGESPTVRDESTSARETGPSGDESQSNVSSDGDGGADRD